MNPVNEWWAYTANVGCLFSWMVEREHDAMPENVADVAYMLEKPWKYQPEWDEMQSEIAQSFAVKDGAP